MTKASAGSHSWANSLKLSEKDGSKVARALNLKPHNQKALSPKP